MAAAQLDTKLKVFPRAPGVRVGRHPEPVRADRQEPPPREPYPLQVVVCLSERRRLAIIMQPHGEKHAKKPMKPAFFVVSVRRHNEHYAT